MPAGIENVARSKGDNNVLKKTNVFRGLISGSYRMSMDSEKLQCFGDINKSPLKRGSTLLDDMQLEFTRKGQGVSSDIWDVFIGKLR